ncbi:hypothetical protein O6H91_09G116900 [Diphasiastrum complanatum]|uniref:Uncharacterized protein n=1 Tax=Diphasiastrum complanatum TaxID=34168 RepID=A0ACC2CTR9_DIPCM|nr:hypothetical protein O6H91_09G116900 [Diphasiastrum complanatum]
MAGGMEVKKNVHVEEWGAYRENLEKAFRFNRRTIGYGLCFGIAVPLILYKGILAEFHKQDHEAGRAPRKFL